MSLVLDTNALIWLLGEDDRLGRKARTAADAALAEDRLGVSAISFWEVGMLVAKGRIGLTMPLMKWRDRALRQGLIERPVTGEIAIQANALDDFHPDPADRLISATALLLGATLLTSDRAILSWDGPLKRQDAKA